MLNRLLKSSAGLALANANDCELNPDNKLIGMSDFEFFSDDQALGAHIDDHVLKMVNFELCENANFPLTGMRIGMGIFDPHEMRFLEELTLSHIGFTSESCKILNLDFAEKERIVLLNVHFINEPQYKNAKRIQMIEVFTSLGQTLQMGRQTALSQFKSV